MGHSEQLRHTLAVLVAATLVVSAATAVETFDLGFREGMAPLRAEDWRSAESCGECHTEQYASWSQSRHRVAHSNDIYVAGLMAEPQRFCVNCHSPFPQQGAEVLANLDWYRSHDPRTGLSRMNRTRAPEPHSSEGITCAACHVRSGEVLSAFVSGAAPHKSREVAAIGTGELCGSCHQFRMPHNADGTLTFTETPMQDTFAEYTAWRDQGGAKTCQDCHMPGGDHVFRGAHDREWLRQSVTVSVDRRQTDTAFTIRSVGVGHGLPSGDLFRRLTLQVSRGGAFETVHTMGHAWKVSIDPSTGSSVKERVGNTSLQPGEPRVVTVPSSTELRWRLVYHYGSATDEQRSLVPLEELLFTVLEGTAGAPTHADTPEDNRVP